MGIVNVQLIEEKRKQLRLTQQDMAAMLEVSGAQYSRLKDGHRQFTLREIEIIWRELNIPITKLIIKQKKK